MNHYETIYIIHPEITGEDSKEVMTKFNDLIEKQNGVLIKEEAWGSQRLAYPVKKSEKGNFVLLRYCGEPGITMKLERDMKLDDRVLKCQTIKLGFNVDAQALVSKEKEAAKSKVPPGGESSAEQEEIVGGEKKSTEGVEDGVQ